MWIGIGTKPLGQLKIGIWNPISEKNIGRVDTFLTSFQCQAILRVSFWHVWHRCHEFTQNRLTLIQCQGVWTRSYQALIDEIPYGYSSGKSVILASIYSGSPYIPIMFDVADSRVLLISVDRTYIWKRYLKSGCIKLPF